MAASLTPFAQPEPFQEMTVAGQRPPDELEQYYQELERVELERRTSKKSRWSRKSFRGVDMHIEELVRARELRALREQEDRDRATPQASRAPSPEPGSELGNGPPTHWQSQPQQPQSWSSPSAAANPIYKKYEIFNPTGPKFYSNHHLSPKSEIRAPSVFSPNFPAFPSTPETPSPGEVKGAKSVRRQATEVKSSPEHMLSPDGAGERFPQPATGKLRRKSPKSSPTEEQPSSVSRSATRLAPSPLSQSTQSMTALNTPEQQTKEPQRLARRLSKRNSQNRGFRGMFSRTSDTEDGPMQRGPNASSASLATTNSRPRPVSIAVEAPPPTKRLSVLGKLAKKLSLAKHIPSQGMIVERRTVGSNGPLGSPPAASAQSARPTFGALAVSAEAESSGSVGFGTGNLDAPQQDGVREQRTPSPGKTDRNWPRSTSALDVSEPAPEVVDHNKHEGERVESPVFDKDTDPAVQPIPVVDKPPAPPSDGRSSPDPQFHIGNLVITNPDSDDAFTEPATTPRAPPTVLPPMPMQRFHVPSIYSDTGATANSSTGSLPLTRLQVVNPSAPTPDPQEQLDRLRKQQDQETPPPVPPVPVAVPQITVPQPQQPVVQSNLAGSRSDLQLPMNGKHAGSEPQLASFVVAPHSQSSEHSTPPSLSPATGSSSSVPTPSTRRTDSDLSERRISRKPAPSILPERHATSHQSSPRPPSATTTGSTRSLPSPQDPTTIAMAKYVAEQAQQREMRRDPDMFSVNGVDWEVVPVKETERKRLKRESTRQRTMSKPERGPLHRGPSGRAPSPPPKSVHRYRLERKSSTDAHVPSPHVPESPSKTRSGTSSSRTKADSPTKTRTDRNKPTPPPPAPSKTIARPVSDVFDEPGQMRAREAFDVERMRKGMSFVGGKDSELPLPPPPVPSRDASYDPEWQRQQQQRAPQRVKSIGSGHTAFVMTPPIVGQPRPGAF